MGNLVYLSTAMNHMRQAFSQAEELAMLKKEGNKTTKTLPIHVRVY